MNAIIAKSNNITNHLEAYLCDILWNRYQGYYDDFRHMEFHQLITNLYAGQGKAERIKNFPFPRQ